MSRPLALEELNLARPSYLARSPSGRYYLQRRLGKSANQIFGQAVLRVSLRTGDFQEARRRLPMMLDWANQAVAAPDLEALGRLFDQQLKRHVEEGEPRDDRTLAVRLGLEHQIRNFMLRANERGFLFARLFEGFAYRWGDFVNQNKDAEANLAAGLPSAFTPAVLPVVGSPALGSVDVGFIRNLVQQELAAKEVRSLPIDTATTAVVTQQEGEPPIPSASCPHRMADLLEKFLAPPDRKRARNFKGRPEAKPIVQFAIDFFKDPILEQIGPAQWAALDEALSDIPHPTNVPRNHAHSLFARYKYAQDHGWDDLVRLTEKTLKSRYWYGLYKFIDWAIAERFYSGGRPKFECIDPENLASLPRDAFEDEEILRILRLPLFTGCLNRTNVWKPGPCFVQSAIYWGYLVCLFTGMRPGEVGQLECAQIRTDGTFFYFDLRPFEARNGRVALQDLRNLKTNAAGRVIPINPLLIELGLLDRMQELSDQGEKRVFPEWEQYVRRDGTVRWSQPLSKSWQYLKNKVLTGLRADVSLYSTRHFFADILDSHSIAQRTRDRILGHVGDVRGRYGRKGILDPTVAAQIESLEPAIMKSAREILLSAKQKADRGELTILRTYR